MRINNSPQTYNIKKQNTVNAKRPAFTSTPVLLVKSLEVMQDGRVFPFQSLISRLDVNCPEDAKTMEELCELWGKRAQYLPQIYAAFKNKYKSLILYKMERLDERNNAGRIQSLMAVDDPDKPNYERKTVVRFLQVAPKILDKVASTVKGSGELMLYAAARLAREKYSANGLGVVITEKRHPFYEHLGMRLRIRQCEEPMYHVDFHSLPEFNARIEQRYGFDEESARVPKLLSDEEREQLINPFNF